MPATHSIETRLILSGLGLADRRTLADLLAFIRDETAWRLVSDLFARWKDKAAAKIGHEELTETDRLRERLEHTASEIMASAASDDSLRLMLWMLLRDAYELDPELTFSNRGAEKITEDLGARMTETYFRNQSADWSSGLPDWARRSIGKDLKAGNFSEMVESYVLAQISSLLEQSAVRTDEERAHLFEEIWQALANSDGAIAAGASADAGKEALIKALSTSGSIASLAIAVEAAGFSAYILAAQASAVIPLVGGKTLVSLLAVMVNPLVVLPAMYFGMDWANKSSNLNLRKSFGSVAGATLAIIGLRAPEEGARVMFGAFAGASETLSAEPTKDDRVRQVLLAYRTRAGELAPASISRVAVAPNPVFSQLIGGSKNEASGVGRFLSRLLREDNESLVAGTLTAGDMVYHASMLDPMAVAAADFSSTQDIDGTFDFAVFADRMYEADGRSFSGAEERLKGYVAEEYVAHRLIEKGHVVTRPDAANQPGYDLIVDGQPVQVKCRDSLSGLDEHFEQYPDVPVIANAELQSDLEASDYEWKDQVYFVEGFSDEHISEITQRSIDAGNDLVDHDAAGFTIGLAAARNLLQWWKGKLTAEEVVWSTAIDAAGKGALSLAGGFTGAAAGLLLLGPAGAVILGPSGAIVASGWFRTIKSSASGIADPEAAEALNSAAGQLLRKCGDMLARKKVEIRQQQAKLGDGPASRYARMRMDDEICFILERECDLAALASRKNLSPRALSDAAVAATLKCNVYPAGIQDELDELRRAREVAANSVTRKTVELGRKAWGGLLSLGAAALEKGREAAAKARQSPEATKKDGES
ncbi:MAG: hypothetical protein R3F18_18400 [Lysobacterales bacterium]|nr:hypothetical protein [Xanthomonadales bacterium]